MAGLKHHFTLSERSAAGYDGQKSCLPTLHKKPPKLPSETPNLAVGCIREASYTASGLQSLQSDLPLPIIHPRHELTLNGVLSIHNSVYGASLIHPTLLIAPNHNQQRNPVGRCRPRQFSKWLFLGQMLFKTI